MIITRDVINNYFNALIPLPNKNVLSKEGFEALADWSEQQMWWQEFARYNYLKANWRSSYMGDPHQFAISLFRFIIHIKPPSETNVKRSGKRP